MTRTPTALLAILTIVFGSAAPFAAAQRETEPSEEEVPSPQGDVLHLKTGMTMRGVQILRSTPQFFEVEVVEGIEPLQIPRKQVESVEYDDIDPAQERLKAEIFPEQQEVSLATGERVSRGLMDMLSGPASKEPLKIERQDFVPVLRNIAKDLGLKLRITPSIRDLQPQRRTWNHETAADTTLMSLLREDLVKQFDYVEVIFEFDTIIVMTKEAAKRRAAARSE